jgi:hypothetical protein
MINIFYWTYYRVIAIVLSFLPLSAFAQSEEAGFTADRPGATTGVDVLPKGRLQWETGVGYQHINTEGLKTYSWTLNTSLLRYGISDYAELRFQGDWNKTGGDILDYNGPVNVAIGTKVRLFDGWKIVPAVSLLGNVYVPSTHYDLMPNNWSGQMGLLFQNQLTPWLSLGYEGDIFWFDNSDPYYFYGFCLGFTVSDRWQLMAEEYNNVYDEDTENWLELGAAYQLSNRVQLDISTDIYFNEPKSFWNVSIGVAWQITKK